MARHLKIVTVNRQFLVDLLNGRLEVEDPLPEGTMVRQVMFDIHADSLLMQVEHQSFPVSREGELFQVVGIMAKRRDVCSA